MRWVVTAEITVDADDAEEAEQEAYENPTADWEILNVEKADEEDE